MDNETISQATTGIDKGAIAGGKVAAGRVRHRRPLHPGGKTAWSCCRRRCRRWGCAGYGGKYIDSAPSIDIVWRSRVATLGGSDMNSRIVQDHATGIDIVLQLR